MAEKIWQIRYTSGSAVTYALDRSPMILGRSPYCDIVVPDPTVSVQHIQFTLDGRVLTVDDLDTRNGTSIDGKRVKKVKLKSLFDSEHRLNIGGVAMVLAYGAKPAPAASGASKDDEEAQWFYSTQGREIGPLTTRQVFAAIDAGALRPTDEFWQVGSAERRKAFEVEGLFDGMPLPSPGEGNFGSLVAQHQCPYCWHRFNGEDILFVAGHPELMGDSVLGADEPQRFLPARFTAEGLALDAKGVVCPDMACPRCHLRIPPTCLDHKPFIVSVVGAPGSGKSYFLASSIWALRTTLPRQFGVRFTDADAVTNRWLNDYEEKLFFQPDLSGHQTIAKTELTAPNVSRMVSLDGMTVLLPLPSLFSVAFPNHRDVGFEGHARRAIVLYDSAGEHFQAGADTAASPVTKHLVHAEGIVFLFDPTEDPRFRPLLRGIESTKAQRQDMLLVEMVARIRKHLGLSAGQKLTKTLVLGISKADLLEDVLPLGDAPWRLSGDGRCAALDMDAIHRVSATVRDLLDRYAPEIVTTIEGFAEKVLYLPNSALGHNPGKMGVRPCDIKPQWVEVPFLYILAQKGCIPTLGPQS
jgi:hypothetical protein